MAKKLTKSDEENLAQCPRGVWFEDIDVFPRVKRTTYSLGRLVAAGYLEKEWRGSLSKMAEYRVIKEPPNQ